LGTVSSNVSASVICRGSVPESYDVPDTYCHEGRQVAVAFDYGNPLSNKILTNGFSFVLDITGMPPDGFDVEAFGGEVRDAFQTGISLWVTSMADRSAQLTPALRQFLKSRTSTSPSGFSLLLPPQVIRLKCRQSATFVVELGFDDEELFPRFPLVLARAKIEGRTIALNMKSFKCFRSELKFDGAKQLRLELDDGCINLVPIMTHELGHAFGLNHFDDVNLHSLMDSQFSRERSGADRPGCYSFHRNFGAGDNRGRSRSPQVCLERGSSAARRLGERLSGEALTYLTRGHFASTGTIGKNNQLRMPNDKPTARRLFCNRHSRRIRSVPRAVFPQSCNFTENGDYHLGVAVGAVPD
jgi:hypothetical protein